MIEIKKAAEAVLSRFYGKKRGIERHQREQRLPAMSRVLDVHLKEQIIKIKQL